MARVVFWILFSFLSFYSQAQTREMEEWISYTKNHKDDSLKAAYLNDLGLIASDYALDEKVYVDEALHLSEKLNITTEKAKALLLRGILQTKQARYDSALINILNAKDLFAKRNVPADIPLHSLYYFSMGNLLLPQGTDNDSTVHYFQSALSYAVQTKDNYLISFCYAGLNTAYSKLRQSDNAIQISRDYIRFAEKTNDTLILAKAYQNMAASYQNANNKELTQEYNNKFRSFLPYLKSPLYQWLAVHNEALALADERKIKEAISLTMEAMKIADEKLPLVKRMETYYLTGYCYFLDNQYSESIKYLLKTKELADTLHAKEYELYAASGLADNYAGLKDFKKAYEYSVMQISLSDSILNEKEKINSNYLFVKYQMAQKEDRIRQQEATIKQKNYLNLLLIGGSCALLIIFLLSYRNYRGKQKLHKQRISELETEQKLNAAQAVLKGEEQERARLAKDLHDGLSGMLSGVKYSLQDMKGNLIMTGENRQAFERSIDMLDSSIKEMRRVAHNMMPEVLVRYGLDAAMRDYISEINKSGIINIVYQSMGMAKKEMERSTAIAIYRIVQELLNNVIKHARATEVLVQVFGENGKLVVNVEDNGKGFDTKLSEGQGGMGWKNIRSRVELLKGTVDIHSSPDKGTAVNLEFNIA